MARLTYRIVHLSDLRENAALLNDVDKTVKKRSFFAKITGPMVGLVKWVRQIAVSGFILSILVFIVVNFYLFASIVELTSFMYVFLLLTLLTDGLFIMVQILHRKSPREKVDCDPAKLTIVIACYNGEEVIGETIKQAKLHVPAKQIIVVSDASTDNTVAVAKKHGVRVIENAHNLSKVFSINRAMESVNTPYVLIMDDDVLLGKITVPTSLLDKGYTAVAFNVMPVEQDSIINRLQVFEYRNSMQIGKNLRGRAGAIGNVSGAIGLYRTDTLKGQITMHSGQFAGEDEQRTLLAHMYGEGKGITYTDQVVTTIVPATYKDLYRQRAYSWSLAVPELLVLYVRILLSPRYHYLLKAEKAHSLYIYFTDPLRLLFLWTLVLRPVQLMYVYGFYLMFSLIVWLRAGAKDHISTVFLMPFYQLWLTLCRFIGNFYWFKSKIKYFRNKFHRIATSRWLKAEYAFVASVFVLMWSTATMHFARDMKLYSQLSSYKLDNQIVDFEYEEQAKRDPADVAPSLSIPYKTLPPPADVSLVTVEFVKGDTARAIAYKAVGQMIDSRLDISNLSYEQRQKADALTLQAISQDGAFITPSGALLLNASIVENAIKTAMQ